MCGDGFRPWTTTTAKLTPVHSVMWHSGRGAINSGSMTLRDICTIVMVVLLVLHVLVVCRN